MRRMKHFCLSRWPLCLTSLVLASGCVVEPRGRGRVYVRTAPPPPAVYVAPAPAPVYAPPPPPGPPVVEAAPVVPETYVWDGYEYVGVMGDQYYYLGPGNVWITMEPFRLERWHSYIRVHPDWRGHAIRNERYRGRVVRPEHRRFEEHR